MPAVSKDIFEEQKKDATLRPFHKIAGKNKHLKGNDPDKPPTYWYRDDGLLMYGNRIVLPSTLRSQTIKESHDRHHLGSTATYRILETLYFCPMLRTHVDKLVRSCKTCQLWKKRQSQRIPRSTHVPSLPMELVSVDLLDLQTRSQGARYVLVILDHLTNFTVLKPLRAKTATLVHEALASTFAILGYPAVLLSDQGSEFLNKLVLRILADTRIVSTPAHTPQLNGKNERLHASIRNMVRALCKKSRDWYSIIPAIQQVINQRPNHLGLSPFELMYARKPRTQIDAFVDPTQPFEPKELEPLIHDVWDAQRRDLEDKATKHGLERHELPELPPGTKVLWARKDLQHGLAQPQRGPFTVVSRENEVYTLRSGNGEITAPRQQLFEYFEKEEENEEPTDEEQTQEQPEEPTETNDDATNDEATTKDNLSEEDEERTKQGNTEAPEPTPTRPTEPAGHNNTEDQEEKSTADDNHGSPKRHGSPKQSNPRGKKRRTTKRIAHIPKELQSYNKAMQPTLVFKRHPRKVKIKQGSIIEYNYQGKVYLGKILSMEPNTNEIVFQPMEHGPNGTLLGHYTNAQGVLMKINPSQNRDYTAEEVILNAHDISIQSHVGVL